MADTWADTSPTLKETQITRGHTGHDKNDADCQLSRETAGQTGNSATGKVVKFNTIQPTRAQKILVPNNSIMTDTTTLR